MSEAWNELQALKSKQLSLREKIAARKELIAKTKNITSSTIETPKPVVPKETPAPSAVQEEPQLTTQVVKLPDIQDETKTPVIVSNCDDKAVIAEKKVKEVEEVGVGKKRPSNEEVVVETKPVKVPKKVNATYSFSIIIKNFTFVKIVAYDTILFIYSFQTHSCICSKF